jgi:hypothetical protein
MGAHFSSTEKSAMCHKPEVFLVEVANTFGFRHAETLGGFLPKIHDI